MTVAFPFSSSCHGEYDCFIHGLLLCLGGYFRNSKGDGLGIMLDLGDSSVSREVLGAILPLDICQCVA